jgi:hypothetical protein
MLINSESRSNNKEKINPYDNISGRGLEENSRIINTQRRSVYSSARSQNKHETAREPKNDMGLLESGRSRELAKNMNHSSQTRNHIKLNVVDSHMSSSKNSGRVTKSRMSKSDINDIASTNKRMVTLKSSENKEPNQE